jgi:hypothetical protein
VNHDRHSFTGHDAEFELPMPGDTKEPFFKLGQQLNLPATCVLSLEGQTP